MPYPILGFLTARAGPREITAELYVQGKSIAVSDVLDGTWAVIEALGPDAERLVSELGNELWRIGRTPPIRKSHRAPEAVLCPVCLGIEPEVWDCETCNGGGKVPG